MSPDRSRPAPGVFAQFLGTFTVLSRYIVPARWRAREEAERKGRAEGTFVNAWTSLYARPYIHGRFYGYGLFNGPRPGVTRDSLDFNHSLRGLSCLLQKHRLRYTIKPAGAVRGLAPHLQFVLLLLLAPSPSVFLLLCRVASTIFPVSSSSVAYPRC